MAGPGFGSASAAIPDLSADLLPIFHVEHVQLQFQVASGFVAVQVANNVIIIALASGRLLRIDLASPQDIDDIDLPRKISEVGAIRRIFLDPTASHLLITTTHGENFYLHSRSAKARHLSRLKSLHIECVAWSPALPTASTREILIGTQDGSIYETYIEGMEDNFMRKDERYLKQVYKTPDNHSVTGLWVDGLPGNQQLRRVIVSTPGQIMHWVGKVQRHADPGSIFLKFFDSEAPIIQDFHDTSANHSVLSISPESSDEYEPERSFAWLTTPGIYHGKLLIAPQNSDLGAHVLSTSKLFSSDSLPSADSPVASIALTHHHVLVLTDTTLYAINQLDDSIVFQQTLVDPGTTVLGLCSDPKKSTFWVFTSAEIYEIGDYLVASGKYMGAAEIWGKSSKSFEEVALTFLERGEQDALRMYLLAKLANLKKSSVMQRIMVASWLIEVFMAKLNTLEDAVSTLASHAGAGAATSPNIQTQLTSVQLEYQDFVGKYKSDLDRKTTYEIISSHGRRDELLYYANSVHDYGYVLAYWIQREKWLEALDVLKRQNDPEIFYKYSSVLMSNAPMETVDILMRQSNLNPRNLIPAMLNYNKYTRVALGKNQAVRYLLFVIHQNGSTDAAVHNTLISIYASHYSKGESSLLEYLESHTVDPRYDADFALRLCIQHSHIQSCVHIYSSMGLYLQAVELALKHGNVELASVIADRPEEDPELRKHLWLAVAKEVIRGAKDIKTAIEFLKRCELLKIEDLIPFFPDFTIIDSFQEEICTALEDYSHHIDQLKKEMDESTHTASHIRSDIIALDQRYAIVEPGERCYVCVGRSRKVRELKEEIEHARGKRREAKVEEFDALVAAECVLCSEFAIKKIDEPFVSLADNLADWAL
ncbi:unnamed protein product [Tuber melanosporum]|uniref:(Perigord truffle) hypothetical protein n=1 Tax=Tuber melanosporum (strain Mel28) TaxID=656061 RepID=D5GD76_TUBMM|nr:uncharacterized protein GSTUM_00006080001 [Tuber melanosporum]CAZ82469.1 unnamed protein product [Tuber melanosporum]